MQEGDYNNRRMIFPEINAKLRTNENFVNQENKKETFGKINF
jgi:hypothetical protein